MLLSSMPTKQSLWNNVSPPPTVAFTFELWSLCLHSVKNLQYAKKQKKHFASEIIISIPLSK